MERQHLSDWSHELSDAEFPAALAALGALYALAPGLPDETAAAARPDALAATLAAALTAGSGQLDWRLPAVRRDKVWLPVRQGVGLPRRRGAGSTGRRLAPAPALLATAWRTFVGAQPASAPGVRLALLAPATRPWRILPFAKLLAGPAVGAASVYLADIFPSDGRTDWRWPFTIATLPDDPLAAALAEQQSGFPAAWPFRFAATDELDARAEVLVIGAGIGEALNRVLDAGLDLRCCLVIVAGLGKDDPADAEPLLRALVKRLSAEGVAVCAGGGSAAELAERIGQTAFALSHNRPLDLALSQAFGSRVTQLLNRDLLALSHLESAVDDLSARLRRLPPTTPIAMSARTLQRLQVPHSATKAVAAAPRAAPSPAGAQRAAPAAEVARSIAGARGGFRFDAESGEAAALSELATQVRDAESQARPPRHVQQKSLRRQRGRWLETRDAYVVGEAVTVRIHIGPLHADSIAAREAFPEDKLPKNRDAHRLQVVFHEPRQFEQPLLAEIVLPREGDSSRASFQFTPRVAGEFSARVTVLHRGRVLQTVLLRTEVVAESGALRARRDGITLEVEARVRNDWSDLGARRRFDAALVLNHTPQGQPRLTGVAGRRAWASDLSAIEEPVRDINDLISAVASKVADHNQGLDQGDNPKLFVDLARIGADLYSKLYLDQLQPLASGGFDPGSDEVTHIQLISTRVDAVVPIEFVYDRQPPDDGATICPQYRKVLASGRCGADCGCRQAPEKFVCPLGFWGLKKVIERHFYSPQIGKPDGAELLVQAEPASGRDRLDVRSGALLGHSREVADGDLKRLTALMNKALKKPVSLAGNWDDWKNGVATAPSLLVAFPHNEGRKQNIRLEIGGSFLATLRLPASYVRAADAPPPLVFLLGCDTASSAEDYANHIRCFRQAGAAAVVSTIATVFGKQAVAVGEKIVARLLGKRPKSVTRLGEIIRDAKRQALSESVPMALCVVAFGDADWRL